jgi:hypothetical protein
MEVSQRLFIRFTLLLFGHRQHTLHEGIFTKVRMVIQINAITAQLAQIHTRLSAPRTRTCGAKGNRADVAHMQLHLPPLALIGDVRRLP